MKKKMWLLTLMVLAYTLTMSAPSTDRTTKTAYARQSITVTAATITLPVSTPSGTPAQLLLTAPSTNTDIVRVDTNTTASATSLPLSPGASVEIANTKSTISVKSDSGTQNLDIVVFYR